MDKKEQKSEFVQKLETTAQDFNKALEGQKGKGFILIGADLTNEDEESRDTQVFIITGGGSTRQIIEALAEFVSHPQTAPMLNEAMNLAMAKKLSKIINS